MTSDGSRPRGRVLQRSQGPQHRLSGRAVRDRRLSGLWRATSNAIDNLAARAYRLRLRLLGPHRRLRHQPDADRLFVAGLDLWPRLLGRACSTRCWSPASASCSRPSSASSSASRGCRRTGWWRKVAAGYVETIRNIPLLLQLLFWYNAVLKALPEIARQLSSLPGGIFLNNRGLVLPQPRSAHGVGMVLVALLARRLSARSSSTSGRARGRSATGQQAPVFSVGAGAGDRPAARRACRSPAFRCTFDYPQAGRFNISGGIEVLPEFVALLFGLSIYTAAFIAEVVRAGILAVSRGQTEAAYALGLQPGADAAARRGAAGDARDHPAADQPVSQPDQELHARGGDRLSGSGAGVHRHGAQPDRPGGRGRRHHHGGLSRASASSPRC